MSEAENRGEVARLAGHGRLSIPLAAAVCARQLSSLPSSMASETDELSNRIDGEPACSCSCGLPRHLGLSRGRRRSRALRSVCSSDGHGSQYVRGAGRDRKDATATDSGVPAAPPVGGKLAPCRRTAPATGVDTGLRSTFSPNPTATWPPLTIRCNGVPVLVEPSGRTHGAGACWGQFVTCDLPAAGSRGLRAGELDVFAHLVCRHRGREADFNAGTTRVRTPLHRADSPRPARSWRDGLARRHPLDLRMMQLGAIRSSASTIHLVLASAAGAIRQGRIPRSSAHGSRVLWPGADLGAGSAVR